MTVPEISSAAGGRSTLAQFVARFLRGAIWLPGKRFEAAALRVLQDVLDASGRGAMTAMPIDTPRGRVKLFCIGDIVRWRADTFLTKEPETIDWIDRFDPGDVFWDIGANVGVYTLYAAAADGVRVLAFEPSAANYLILNRSIELNGFQDHVTAYCMAFSDQTMASVLHMQDTGFGQAMSSFDDLTGYDGGRIESHFQQGMLGYSIDDFIATFDPPFPNRIKIDVDGIEDRIIAGARRTLADPRLKSLSLELDVDRPDYTNDVVARVEASGLRFVGKYRDAMFDDSRFSGIYNFHFDRLPAVAAGGGAAP